MTSKWFFCFPFWTKQWRLWFYLSFPPVVDFSLLFYLAGKLTAYFPVPADRMILHPLEGWQVCTLAINEKNKMPRKKFVSAHTYRLPLIWQNIILIIPKIFALQPKLWIIWKITHDTLILKTPHGHAHKTDQWRFCYAFEEARDFGIGNQGRGLFSQRNAMHLYTSAMPGSFEKCRRTVERGSAWPEKSGEQKQRFWARTEVRR